MNDLAIGYFEYAVEQKYDKNTGKFVKGKGIDKIRTCGGDLYTTEEWTKKAFDYVKEHELGDLYMQVKEYVIENHPWAKKEATVHALDCLLHESYKHWEDFVYQEKLKL